MLGTRRVLLAWSIGAACSATGCGDPPLCQQAVFVAVQTSQISVDVDPVLPGVQGEIRVRSSLAEGETIRLEVIDANGVPIGLFQAQADAEGTAVFTSVSVPKPKATLRASAATICGRGDDELTVDVTAGAGCELALTPAPESNAFYAPLGVLSTLSDPEPGTPGYQTTVLVATHADWTVELYENTGKGEELVATVVANANGLVSLPRGLDDGQISLRATCRGAGSAASLTTVVLVDLERPSCAFATPSPGTTITPAMDQNQDLDDGVQLAIAMRVGGDDVLAENVTLDITAAGGSPMPISTLPVDATGTSTALATLAPPSTPASFGFAMVARDHAGNLCMASESYQVVYNGCDIAIVSPTAPVTDDADGNPGNGSQVDVTLQIAEACVGRTVTSACGTASPSGIVPAGGQLVLRPTVCSTSPCEAAIPCAFFVTTTTGVQTTASTTLAFDDQPPAVSLELVNPALVCGAQITPASDADPSTDGVQLVARVISPAAATKSLELTNGSGTVSFDASADVTVTLAPGVNRLVGIGVDTLGNSGQTANCNVTLADLSVSFSPPAADGLLGRADGTVSGSAVTFPLCGTVNKVGATVQITIDGAPPVPANVSGTTWCRTVTLAESPPSHTIVVNATAGVSFGSGSLVLGVDLTVPPPIPAFVASAINRQRIAMTWQAPSDAGQPVDSYLLKFATVALTEANFDTTGTVIPTAPPAAPGSDEAAQLFPARTGTTFWIGIASRDAAGNRSSAIIVSPLTPDFQQSGAIVAPDQTQGSLALGYAIAHGRFNNDDFEDLAVSAPTQNTGTTLRTGAVYVYFGGPLGIAATPDLTITSTVGDGRLGAGLTAVRWSSATRDDLVIGAPGITGGHIYVLRGGAAFGLGTRAATTAEVQISVHPTMPGWFAASQLGSSLASADVDGDGTLDLVASAPAGGGTGGVVILYGDTVTGNVLLSDVSSSGINGAVCELFRDPGPTPGRQLGFFLHAVGPTMGMLDATDDLVIAYADDTTTAGDSLYVLRSDGTRPATPGVATRLFTVGRDVRLDYVTATNATEWGSQATSIADQNGDGARDLVISAYLANGRGQTLIVSGNSVGSGGVATTTATVLTTINHGGVFRFGAVVFAHDAATSADIDGDGLEDLAIGGAVGGIGRAYIWFGGSIPVGVTTTATAIHTLDAPALFGFSRQAPQGIAGQGRWVGDLDGDGLDDACWTSPFNNNLDGSFEILSD